MDETDFSLFKSKKSSKKHDKADATACSNNKNPECNSETGPSEETTKKEVISVATDDHTYNCDNRYVGVALIFNHKEVKGQKPREGTEKDRDALRESLERYGFDVRVYDDYTFEKVNESLKSTAKEDHSNHDCLLVAVMSHGAEGKIYAKDMTYPTERLWNPFLGTNCPTLINKPKIFIIQACRGEILDKPVTYETTSFSVMSRSLTPSAMPEPPTTYAIPNTADILVFYSTFERHYSFRNVEDGSWFIQTLSEVLDDAANDEITSKQGYELLRLFTAVNRRVAYEKQSNTKYEATNQMKEMPNFMSTLTKTFYLRMKPKSKSNEIDATDH